MNLVNRHLVVALALTLLSQPLLAQQRADTVRLAPVVTSATRVPLPQRSVPATVTVLDGDSLRREGIWSVADALRNVPGVAVAQGGSAGSLASLFVRGGESDYVKVLVDGVPLNASGGAIDLANLTIDGVERIEVVRGPASVLVGSEAMTGVIHIVTERGEGSLEASASVRAGSYATRELAASIGAGAERWGGTLDVSHHATDGVLPFNNRYRNTLAGGSLRATLPARAEARLTARRTDAEFHYPTNGAGAVVDRNAFRAEVRTLLGLELAQRFGERWRARIQLASNDADARTSDRPDDSASFGYLTDASMRRRSVDARLAFEPLAATTITVGAEREWARERSRSTYFSPGAEPFREDPFTPSRGNDAAYAEITGTYGDRATFTMGARRDDNERYGRFATRRVGASVRVGGGTRVRASAGNAFKAPTLYENASTAPFARGNPALRPERSSAAEVGLEHVTRGGRLTMGVTAYAQRFRDLVDYTGAPAEGAPHYYNVPGATARGVEVEGRAALPGGWSVGANQTWLRTRVTDPGFDRSQSALFVEGKPLLRRPDVSGFVRLGWRGTRLGASLTVQRVGARDDRDFSTFPGTPVRLAPYTRADLAGDWTLRARAGRTLALTARAENLLDRRYEPIRNFPAPGRTILVGVRVGQGDAR